MEVPTEAANEVTTSFEGMALSAPTHAAIADMGITEPTPIQNQSIPYLLPTHWGDASAGSGIGSTLYYAVSAAVHE